LLVNASLVETIIPHLPELPNLEHVLVFGGSIPPGLLDYDTTVTAASAAPPGVVSSDDDLHVIRFSAGTTGRPKGIVHTVGQWLANDDEYRWMTPQLDERDAYLAAGQLTHAAALWFWPLLTVGGRILVVTAFDAEKALQTIEEQRATVTLMVPTMIQAMLAAPGVDTRDLSSLRCLNYAASPISETTMTRALEKFGPVLYQLYAQSECITVTMLRPHEHRPDGTPEERRLMRSVGRPTPHTTVTVVDDSGNPVPAGEVGEIAVRGRGGMLGLWKDTAGTAARLLPDGSILTRDMGYVDEQGYVFLSDRKEDLIISGGYNIWPAELENVVAAMDGVSAVCVVGVPHAKWGESPQAHIVLEAGAALSEDEVIAHTRAELGSIKKVTSVEFVDHLPTSGVGKVLRRAVRETIWKGAETRVGSA
ncbi:MAG: AMP-binding protein, partial [Sciscionella sp.]